MRLTLLSVLLISQTGIAQVSNGDFENFSGNTADGWTTIDSGISLAPGSTAATGSQSAAITVTTASQSSTDFRQDINVSAGTSYDFSAQVYHTEGGVRARLYVDGYRNYSNAGLTNQWQTISYTYTASATETIQVGLRFYDNSSFDGSELVYVDDFQPTDSAASTGCTANPVTLELLTDNYGSETSWQLTSASGTVSSGSGYANNTTYSEEFCLTDGNYTFTINDSYGDGICCSWGQGYYELRSDDELITQGGEFSSSESVTFSLPVGGAGGGGSTGEGIPNGYYNSAQGLSGYSLKSALHNIIDDHSNQGYGGLWGFYSANEIDRYYENDGSILDIYSERPTASDPYTFTPGSDQCGNYSGEGDCYNREHSFPRSWFGGDVEPMNSDVHHIFASDGQVNAYRGSYPYGEITSPQTTSANGSLVGTGASGLGYSGTVFEPIDEFKGDIARAQFYMAVRYEDVIANWENNSGSADDALNGTGAQVFETWYLDLLKSWHQQDPVSQKEIDRNNAAYDYQGNRNPFIDHPEYVSEIWGN
jgi:endonuclease I